MTTLIQNFTLHKTRQGCPLSSSIFAIFTGPLAAPMWQNGNIKGIQTSTTQHKIILYARDLLLLLQDPYSSLQKCFMVIKSFSELSSYLVNWSKSTILPLDMDERDVAALASPYNLHSGNIEYLGINISAKLLEL